jgi:uncharacterized delta-60 repeat protein
VTTEIPGTTSTAEAALVTPNNRIVVAGQTVKGDNSQAMVARYLSNGLLDKSFGTNGIFTTSVPASDGPLNASAIAYQPATGGLVAAGRYAEDSILLLRLTPAGQLDPKFGPDHNGLVRLKVDGPGISVATDGSGRILVGAWNRTLAGAPMVVARFSPDGVLDTSFGQAGIVQVAFWDTVHAASSGVVALTAAADGSVIGVGHIDYIGLSAGGGTAGVFRLLPSGALAPGFGRGGHIEIAFESSSTTDRAWFPCAMVLDSRGRIVVTGADLDAPDLLTARLTPNGALDSSFGTGGRVVTSGLGGNSGTNCGAAADSRNAVTVGMGATLVQLTSTGVPNTNFGPGGFVPIGTPPQVSLFAVTRAGAGRIVLAGSAGQAVYLARYLTH